MLILTGFIVGIFLDLFGRCHMASYHTLDEMGWIRWSMGYVDRRGEFDLFFDRVVPVVLNVTEYLGNPLRNPNIAIGVLIDSQRVLTSYNPFRALLRSQNLTSKLVVTVVRERVVNSTGPLYRCSGYSVSCGRQVVCFPDDEIPYNQWHGTDRKHSPVHDLMVLRLEDKVSPFSEWDPEKYVYEKLFPPNGTYAQAEAGPFLTKIARPGEPLHKTIKFTSLGFRDEVHVEKYRGLRTEEYGEEDNVVVNCDEWLPREWGHFICILNINNYPGLGSSALLFSNNKLYGVGSFLLFRGKNSIFAFTDVRKYYNLIMHTCNFPDASPSVDVITKL